jgi:hypothetical protein
MGVKMGEYLSLSFSVANASSLDIRVVKDLGRPATVGKIYADNGTIYAQVSPSNGGAVSENKITIFSGESFPFDKADGWIIGQVLITTDGVSAVSGRIFLK